MSVVPTPSDPDLRSDRARLRDDATLHGAALRAALVELTDEVLARLFAELPGQGLALVAVGAYGRREPAFGSDLDLVLLHADRADVKEVADALWYPLWDTGVPVDHSVRTVAEAVTVARDDLRAALGLLDARHVAGDDALTGALRESVHGAWRSGLARRLPEVRASARDREQAHGEVAFLLEPDLKLARGGLRDVELLRALAAAWVVDAPSPAVRQAHLTLLDARGELHRRLSRPTDRMLLQEQDAVAEALGHADADALMTEVYAAGRAVAFALDEALRRAEAASAPRRRLRRGPPPRRPLADGVVEQGGEVVLAVSAAPADDPALVLRVAAAAAAERLPLSPHTRSRLADEAAPLPDPWPRTARDALVALLGAGPPAVPVVEALDQAGLMVRLLPEWDLVRCRPQRNAYHRFTVDRHLLETAVNAAALTRRVARPDLLLLGALLHDIGKGLPGDHTDRGVELVARIGPRLGLPAADVDVLVAMVRHHLLLADTATRRDIDAPETVERVAAAVGDRETLDLLHALTEADSLATGPAAWSDWKAGLVDALATRVRGVLAGTPHPAPALWSPRQLELAAAGGLALDVDGETITVVAPDRPGLMWRWAAVLALHRLDVRSATAGAVGPAAVTAFAADPRYGSPPDWSVVRDDLRRAYSDAAWLVARLDERDRAYRRDPTVGAAPCVLFDDEASPVATVVEVRAHDRVGLLYRLARALSGCGLDVQGAHVSTLGAEAVDAFYVTGADGGLLADPGMRARVEHALLAALADPAE